MNSVACGGKPTARCQPLLDGWLTLRKVSISSPSDSDRAETNDSELEGERGRNSPLKKYNARGDFESPL